MTIQSGSVVGAYNKMIRKLPQEVINKIAAGEVIQRPYNVIKELVENAVDAEATQIQVVIINGGMESIQVIDNGKGIRREDFDLLCERFATSKICNLKDLQTIQSFGFRGEALASLSYVSQLEISSKHRNEGIGYRCTFRDEKMMEEPEPFSTNTGTKIKASKLFGNLETRRASLNVGEEKKRVIRLVSHFALHYHSIKFSVETEKGQEFSSDAKGLGAATGKMRVFQLITKLPFDKFIYLPKEMIEEIKIEGMITKLNTTKSKSLLLNVNSRIVQNVQITKIIERAYAECYQSIHQENQGYNVYLSIEIDPKKIDCNQHPSKKVIAFFNADRIYDNIFKWVLERIKEESSIKSIATNVVTKGANPFNASKNMVLNFKSQALASQGQGEGDKMVSERADGSEKPDKVPQGVNGVQMKDRDKPLYDFQKTRTDSLQMPINFYMKQKESQTSRYKQLKFKLRESQKELLLPQNTKKFFQHVSYVGCFNLNYIFIQIDTRLYCMNVVPCLESFVREWLRGNSLVIHEIVERGEHLDLRTIIQRFLVNKQLEGRIKVDELIDKIFINKYLLARQYGIVVEEVPNQLEGTITAYPVFDKFMADRLDQDELAYFLCRLLGRQPSNEQCQGYFVEFLTSFFEEGEQAQMGLSKKQNQREEVELSPMNDIYSEFFRDKVIPVLKTKGRDYQDIEFEKHLTEMVNLQHIYKIFQRC